MAFILNKDKGQRMWGGGKNTFNSSRQGGGGSGAGGGGGGISSSWVDDNYVSKDYFNQLFKVKVAVRVLVTDPSTTPATVISDTSTVRQDLLYPNEVPEPSTTTDEETGYVTSTTYSIDSIQVMGGLWTNSYLSALGQNSSGGGGGGGSLNEPLSSINMAGLSAPGAAQNGQTVVWNQATGRWVYGSTGSGTVTSITAGTGLSGGTITGSGTIAIDSTYQTYISHGETAYGWGNHTIAGYATQTWVNNQNFLTQTAGDARYLTISFFRSLFRAYNSSETEVQPNTGDTSTIDNIKAMFGFWTNAYISALGQNSSGGGGGGSSTLAGLNDVALDPDPLTSANANDVLSYNGNGHWINVSKSSFLSGYATQTWVQNQGYLTGSDLTGYATQSWVTSQNYLTGITSSMVTTALGFTPMNSAVTFWGQSVNNGAVSGSLTNVGNITSSTVGSIINFNAIEFAATGTAESGNGGALYFHFPGVSGHSSAYILEEEEGVIALHGKLKIGSAYIEWDSTNSCLKISSGLYSNSFISALGLNSSGGGGGGSSTLAGLNDVALDPDPLTSANANDVLSYNGNGHWINVSKSSFLSGYVTTSDISDMATQTWVQNQGYLTGSDLTGYATQTWVQNQGYLTGSDLTGYATQTWVQNQGYLTGSDLTGYATQSWVTSQNYLTGITSSQVTTALGYTPLSNSTTFWGQSVSIGVVQGNIEAGLVGGAITGFHSIELNSHGTLSDYGGFIDFHFNGSSSDYTSRIIEDANGRLFMDADNGVRIGNAVLKWDSTNNALYVQRSDGSAANLYATGGVSALGMSAGTSSVDAMTFNYVTINSRLTLPSGIIAGTSPMITRQSDDSDCVYLFYADAESKISSYSYYYNQYDNVGLRGTNYNFDEQWWIDPDGCARFQRLYLDATRYLYVSNGDLYYNNGSTSRKVAFTN